MGGAYPKHRGRAIIILAGICMISLGRPGRPARWGKGSPESSCWLEPLCGRKGNLPLPQCHGNPQGWAVYPAVTIPPLPPAKVEDIPVSPCLPYRAFLGDGHSSADSITLFSRSRLTGKCGPSPNVTKERLLPGIQLHAQSSLCWTVGGRR